jgi:hypothetical protein
MSVIEIHAEMHDGMKIPLPLQVVTRFGEVKWSGNAKVDGIRVKVLPGWYVVKACGAQELDCTSAEVSVQDSMLVVVQIKLGMHWVN